MLTADKQAILARIQAKKTKHESAPTSVDFIAMGKKKVNEKLKNVSVDDSEVNTAFSVGDCKVVELIEADAADLKEYLVAVLSNKFNTITVKPIASGHVISFKPKLAADVVELVTKAWA